MNTKLALATLLVSFALSCSVSEGQLIDRMLSKAGCSACGTTSGCGGGLLSGGCGLGIGENLKGRIGDCGCGAAAPVADCGCGEVAAPVVDCGCSAPAPAPIADCGCGEIAAPAATSCGCGGAALMQNLRNRFDGLGSRVPTIGSNLAARAPVIGFGAGAAGDCGCGAPVADCGCGAPAPAPIADCGCGAPIADCGCSAPAPAPVADCGCSAPAPAPAPAPIASCGCDAAPASAPSAGGCQLLNKLRERMSSFGSGGGCGCAAAPVASDCGCGAPAAPIVTPAIESSCGCSAPAPAPVSDCGCGAPAPAPVVSDCGCGAPAPVVSDCGCGGGGHGGVAVASARGGLFNRPQSNLTLLDRLRGNRIPRDRDGRVIGSGNNNGCNPPCPGARHRFWLWLRRSRSNGNG